MTWIDSQQPFLDLHVTAALGLVVGTKICLGSKKNQYVPIGDRP